MTKREYGTITIDSELKKQLAERKPKRATWAGFLESEILGDGESA